jgi:hypothetical protein
MDDQSGVRGAQMLAPNRFAPTFAAAGQPLRRAQRHAEHQRHLDVRCIGHLSWNLNDAWTLKSVTAYRESDTETNIDFDTLPNTIADVKAFYSDDQVSQEFQLNYDAGGDVRGVTGLYWFTARPAVRCSTTSSACRLATPRAWSTPTASRSTASSPGDFAEQWALTLGARYTDEEKTRRRPQHRLHRRHLHPPQRRGGGGLRGLGQLPELLAEDLARLPGQRRDPALRPGLRGFKSAASTSAPRPPRCRVRVCPSTTRRSPPSRSAPRWPSSTTACSSTSPTSTATTRTSSCRCSPRRQQQSAGLLR